MVQVSRREISLGKVLLIYLLGLMAGVQAALYLFDLFDDSVAEPLSGGIAAAMVAAGLGLVAWTFRRPRV